MLVQNRLLRQAGGRAVAFVLVAIHDLDTSATDDAPRNGVRHPFKAFDTYKPAWHRSFAFLLVLLAHLAAFWLVRQVRTETVDPSEVEALIVTNIPQADPMSVTPQMPATSSQPTPQLPSLPPPEASEWSLAKITVQQQSVTPTAVSAAPPAPESPGSTSSTGSSAYDPYAGVAPLRQSGPPSTIPAPMSPQAPATDIVLGRATVERLASAVRDRARASRGQAHFRAIVATDGSVVRVDILSSTLSDQARILLIEEVRILSWSQF